ncbi:MAG: sugar ABC transporter permease [Firmicutes bacterium]|nr:sugar ABC transporter permease [Bacillota bacterium]
MNTGAAQRYLPAGWRRKEWYAGATFLIPTVLFLGFTSLYPLIYALILSFHRLDLKFGTEARFIGLGNYLRALTDPFFGKSVITTVLFVIITVAGETVLGMVIALLVSQQRGYYRLARSLLLIPLVMTPVVIGILWRMLFNPDFGLINYIVTLLGGHKLSWLGTPSLALVGVMLVDIWEWTPFVALCFVSGITALPYNTVEAALVDGASSWQLFWRVTLPLLRPVILVTVLLRLLDAFKVVDTIYVMTAGGPGNTTKLLSLFIYEMGLKYFNIGYASALSWIFIVLMLVLTFYFLKERGSAL